MKIVDPDSYRREGYGAGAGGSISLWFSFVTKKEDVVTFLHRSYQCRMFLVDDVHANRYRYDKETRLFIHGKKEYIDNMFRNLPFLHKFEQQAGISLTQLTRYDDEGVLVEGDALWQSNLWKISLYSFLLKCLAYPEGSPSGEYNAEIPYYTALSANIDLLCANLKNDKEADSKTYDYYTNERKFWNSHTNAGFYEILTGGNKRQLTIMKEYMEKVEK